MPYQQLSATTPVANLDRIANLEVDLQAQELPGLFGSHFYAGGIVPNVLASFGTDSAGIATQIWVCELRIPQNVSLTGLAFLIGSVGATDNVIVVLYDAQGNVLAWSALAGTLVGTASTFQRVAFTAAYQAKPGKYYVGVSTNGTTAKLQTQIAGNHDAGVITGQVFGTLNSITPPSTFSAGAAPVVMSY